MEARGCGRLGEELTRATSEIEIGVLTSATLTELLIYWVLGKSVFGGLMARDFQVARKDFQLTTTGLDRIVEVRNDRDEFYSTCGRLIGFGLSKSHSVA